MKTKITFFAAVGLMAALSFATVQTAHAQCRDPWINNAYRELADRAPVGTGEVGECNIKFYNNGSWNSYDELKRYVQQVRSNVKIGVKDQSGGKWAVAVQGNGATGVVVMSKDGRILSSGGGYLIGNDAAGLVGLDNGTISVTKNTPGFAFTGDYGTLSGTKIKTSGKGGIKIQ
jgi:hypothetical protein